MVHKITLIFGETAVSKYADGELKTRADVNDFGTICDYEFATEAELNAFMQGVEEAIGWLEFDVVEEELPE